MSKHNKLPPTTGPIPSLYDAAREIVGENSPLHRRTTTGNTEAGRNTSFGESKYDTGFFPNLSMNWDNTGMDLNEQIGENRAQNQPWIAKVGAGAGRVGVKVAAEISKIPGILGGVVAGTVGQIADGITGEDNTDFMQTAFNNAWIKGINDANEYVNNEALPVYVKKAVQEGDIWDNLKSVDFWATEGADGLGYMISMLAPGAIITKLALGSKLVNAGIKGSQAIGKYAKMTKSVDKAMSTLSKIGVNPKNLDMHMATVANTLFEAGAEAQGAMDAAISDPKNKEAIDKIADEIYTELLIDYRNNGAAIEGGENAEGKLSGGAIKSEEQTLQELREKAQDKAGKQFASSIGRDVLYYNAAVLIGPNAVMSKMLWGGKNTNKFAKKIKADSKGLERIANPTFADKAKLVGKEIGSASLREGVFEEGMQSAGEHYISEVYREDKDYHLGDFARSYIDMAKSTEGQKAMVLGAFFGSGMQAYQGLKHESANVKSTNKLVEYANEELKNGYSILNEDIYKKDEDGKVILKKENGEDTPEIDKTKFLEKLQSTDKLEQLSVQYDIAVAQGNTAEVEMIQNIVTTQMIMPFVTDQNLGLEILKQHLDASADLVETAKAQGRTKEALVDQIMNKAKKLQQAQETFDDFSATVFDVEEDGAEESDYEELYTRLNSIYLSSKSQEFHISEQLGKYNGILDKLLASKGKTKDDFDNNPALFRELMSTDVRFENVVAQINEAEDILKVVTKKLDGFWSKDAASKQFKKQLEDKKKLEAEIEEGESTAEDTLEEIKKAITEKDAAEIGKGKPKEEAKRKEEEAAVNKIVAGVEANPSIDNLKNALNDLNNLKISTYSINHILDAIEKRITDTVKEQEAFSEFLDTLFVEVSASIATAKDTIKEIDSSIKSLKRKQKKTIADLAKQDRSPRGRNAKILKQAIKDTEKEIRLVDLKIAELEKEKESLEKEIERLDNGLDSVVLRAGQVEINDFKTIEEVISFVKENADKFKEHKFELQRLLVHKHYAEENVDAISSLISELEDYRDVLEDTLKQRNKHSQPNLENLDFLKEELTHTNGRLTGLSKKLSEESNKLYRLQNAISNKQVFSELMQELEFWENVQKTRKKNPISKVYDNPIVNEAVIEQQNKIKAQKAKEAEEAKLYDEQVKEAALATAEAEEAGIETAQQYYEFVLNNMNVGEGIPTPPPSFPISQKLREEEGPYILSKKEGDKISIKRGYATGVVSSKSFKTTTSGATEVESSSENTDPLANTEGGLVQTYVEAGSNLPISKDGEVIDNNLQEINNDARVITGTDSETGLSFISSTMVDFERTPRNKKGDEVTFEVNTQYDKGNQGKALKMLPTATAADLDFLIEHLPINAVFSETAKAPLETRNENPNLTKEQRDEYNKVFDKSSKLLRTAIIKEMVLNKTPISDITTTIAGQKNGSIMVDPIIDHLAAENPIKELREFGGELKNVKTDLIYVVNDKGVLVNHKNKQYPLNRQLSPGEVYIMIHTANGTNFPLKLNISKVKEAEADLLYELYKFRFEAGYKKAGKELRIDKTNDAIIQKVQEVFKEELGEDGLFTKNKKKLKDLSIGDVVNFLVWDGTASKKSQIRFYKDHLKVLGNTYTKEEFANSREEFIQNLVENKRRNITFKRSKDEDTNSLNFDNPSYVNYILEKNILNTNAVTGKDENGIYRPTFGKDTTIYLDTSNVKVSNKLSDYNQAKKVTFINTLRGKKSDLAKALKGLFKKTLKLVGQDFYQEENNPKGTRYSRISNVTSEKEKKENLTSPLYYNAAKRGDVVDSLFRTFFSTGIKDEAAFLELARKELDDVNKAKTLHGDISISDNAFRELYNIAKDYEIEFNRRGYTIYSTTNPLYGVLSKGKRNVNTAGSMDLLAKDKTGRYIIIDIKTSSSDRYENYQREDGGYYKEKDLRQQNGYAELFKQRTGITISEILILPISMQAKKDKAFSVNSVYTSATRSKSPTGFIEVDMSRDIFEIMGERKPTSTDFSDPTKKKDYEKKTAPSFKDVAGEQAQVFDQQPGEFVDQKEVIFEGEFGEDLDEDWDAAALDSLKDQFPDAFEEKGAVKKPVKKSIAKPSKQEAVKKPKADSGRPITFDKDGKSTKVILWNSGKVTDMDRKEITDPETVRLAKVAGGIIAGEGGKSETEIRKDEKKAVSLSSTKKVMETLDVNKLTDEEANSMLLGLVKLKSLRGLRKLARDIDSKEITPQEKVAEMLVMIENKGLADAEVRKICKI